MPDSLSGGQQQRITIVVMNQGNILLGLMPEEHLVNFPKYQIWKLSSILARNTIWCIMNSGTK